MAVGREPPIPQSQAFSESPGERSQPEASARTQASAARSACPRMPAAPTDTDPAGRRAKKPPERPGPRGAKDSIRFRERLDAGPTGGPRIVTVRLASGVPRYVVEATRRPPCRRGLLRGPQDPSGGPDPSADPSTWLGEVCLLPEKAANAAPCRRYIRRRVACRPENRRIAAEGQGRFRASRTQGRGPGVHVGVCAASGFLSHRSAARGNLT
jgi:hypothetical protein